MDQCLLNADKVEDICVKQTSPTEQPLTIRQTHSAISNRPIQNGEVFSKLLDKDSTREETKGIRWGDGYK